MKQPIAILILLLFFTACHKRVIPVTSASSGSTIISSRETAQASETAVTPTVTNSSEILAGNKLYRANCGKCHELKDPGSYKKDRWNSIMITMAPKAKLDDKQKSLVLAYVLYSAKDGLKNGSN
ncbi:MAG: cytochrome c [Ferruginibacter sp.]